MDCHRNYLNSDDRLNANSGTGSWAAFYSPHLRQIQLRKDGFYSAFANSYLLSLRFSDPEIALHSMVELFASTIDAMGCRCFFR